MSVMSGTCPLAEADGYAFVAKTFEKICDLGFGIGLGGFKVFGG